MKILHYNILNGFEHLDERIRAFVRFISNAEYDVLLLNEYRSNKLLNSLLHEQGYSTPVVGGKESSPNKVALFSRVNAEPVPMSNLNLRCAALRCGGTLLVSYHASPKGVAEVVSEVERLVQYLKNEERVLLCGDFNSLSPNDKEGHQYGVPERYCIDGKVSYQALSMLYEAGFADPFISDGVTTVPTGIERDHENGLAFRLDYTLARNLEIISADVVKDPLFHMLSDHYPIQVSFGGM